MSHLHIFSSKLYNKKHECIDIIFQSKPGEIDVPILKSCYENFSFFVENYFLASDSFRRKSMLFLAHIVAICKGRYVS